MEVNSSSRVAYDVVGWQLSWQFTSERLPLHACTAGVMQGKCSDGGKGQTLALPDRPEDARGGVSRATTAAERAHGDVGVSCEKLRVGGAAGDNHRYGTERRWVTGSQRPGNAGADVAARSVQAERHTESRDEGSAREKEMDGAATPESRVSASTGENTGHSSGRGRCKMKVDLGDDAKANVSTGRSPLSSQIAHSGGAL